MIKIEIYYYGDENGLHQISGTIDVGINEGVIIGVVVNGVLRPAYDRNRQRVVALINTNGMNRNLALSSRIAETMGFGLPPQQTMRAIVGSI